MKHGFLIGILFLGLAEFSYGLWIPAKAWLSQVLLEQAWQDTLHDSSEHKPWPWADTWPVLKLVHHSSDSEIFVLHGESGQALAFGPGLNPVSSRPGTAGNTIISAHRDTHFRFLEGIEVGQLIDLQDIHGNRFTYSVTSLDIANSLNTSLEINTREDLLTLVTCYPFNQVIPGGPMRYVVTAIRTETATG